MKTLHTETQKQILSNQVLAEYFLHSDANLDYEESNEEFILHIPKSFFYKQKIHKPTKVQKKPSIASVAGMFKHTDDGRKYKEMLDEAREERLEKYL